jgi:hypothetical protein
METQVSGIEHFLKRKITADQSRDTGMAMVLLLLILSVVRGRQGFVTAAMVLLVVTMTAPKVYRHVAVVWLGLSELMGAVVSRLLLSIVFFAVVTPIGVLRRAMGKDSLKLRAFKGSQESVMLRRNHTFTGRDIEKPY